MKGEKSRIGSFFLFILYPLSCIFFFCSCNPSRAPTRIEGVAMTIPYCVQIGEPLTQTEIASIERLILSTFAEIDQIYNNWNPKSEISKLNRLSAHQRVSLSSELASFLAFIDLIFEKTEGRFDPTIEPLQQLWKKWLKDETLPPEEKLAECADSVGWEKIHVENGLFWKEHSLTAIDLGGIAKGYAVDLIVQRLVEAGYAHVYVEWGGEIRVQGQHPEHRPWKIGIWGLHSLDLINTAIATSGSYAQNWTIDTVNYTHIIDPRTKLALQNAPISSVSVIAPTCIEADALATALMLFTSKEEAEKWAKERNIKVYIW